MAACEDMAGDPGTQVSPSEENFSVIAEELPETMKSRVDTLTFRARRRSEPPETPVIVATVRVTFRSVSEVANCTANAAPSVAQDQDPVGSAKQNPAFIHRPQVSLSDAQWLPPARTLNR